MNQAHPQSFPTNPLIVLSYKGQTFTADDIIEAAWVLGQLQSRWNHFQNQSAFERRAAQLELEPEEEVLQQMSEEFRYERDLLTTEEAERWLASRDINEEEFGEYFARAYWADHLPEDVLVDYLEYPEAKAGVRKTFRGDLFLSREFDQLARVCSWRLASENEPVTKEEKDAVRKGVLTRLALTHDRLRVAVQRLERSPEWLDQVLVREASFQRVSGRVLQEEQRARLLSSMRLALTRVEIESFGAQSRDAAEKAFLCLKEGSASMDEMAAECEGGCERQRVFLGDCPEDLQATLLSAPIGQVLPLQDLEGHFLICKVVSKTDPQLEDAEIRQRLDQKLLEAYFAQESNGLLSWAAGWEPAC